MQEKKQEQKEIHSPRSFSEVNRSQKIMLSGLGLFTIVLFVFVFLQIDNRVDVPVPVLVQDLTIEDTDKDDPLADTEALKLQDTDEDGLTDYDELTIWYTSPYIADSDSDGISDYDEIASDADPNCPEGQVCGSISTSPVDFIGSVGDLIDNETGATASVDEIRSALLETGQVAESDLVSLSDEQILSLYKQVTASEIPSTDENVSYTPEDLRKLLLQAGMEASDVSALDDQELVDIYNESLNQIKN